MIGVKATETMFNVTEVKSLEAVGLAISYGGAAITVVGHTVVMIGRAGKQETLPMILGGAGYLVLAVLIGAVVIKQTMDLKSRRDNRPSES
jgi:hypothetical protein